MTDARGPLVSAEFTALLKSVANNTLAGDRPVSSRMRVLRCPTCRARVPMLELVFTGTRRLFVCADMHEWPVLENTTPARAFDRFKTRG